MKNTEDIMPLGVVVWQVVNNTLICTINGIQ